MMEFSPSVNSTMKNNLKNIIDFLRVDSLLEGFNKSTGFVTAILDLEGNILSKSGWMQICTEFHRNNPESSKKCTVSDTELSAKMAEGEKYHFYKCLNGLVDVAVPVVINGEHVANLFSGQFFFDEPDISFFKEQAKQYGFDEEKYIAALKKVPVVSGEKVKIALDFLLDMTRMISDIAFQKLELEDLNRNLRESEEKFKAVFESANTGKSITLPSGEISANRAFCDMLGYTREELLGKKWQDLTPADEIPAVESFINSLLNGEKNSARFEKRYICKDGSFIWADVSVSLRRDDNGNPLHFIATIIDITERRQAVDAVHDIARRNLLATEASGVGIWEWSLNSNRVRWDKQMFQIYGMVPTDDGFVDYSVISACVPQEELPEQESILQETIKQRGRSIREFHIRRCNDRQLRSIQAIDTVLTDENGVVQWLLGTNIDITERKEVENKLLESEERFRKIFAEGPLGMVTANLYTGKFLSVNKAFCHMLGYSEDELSRLTFMDVTYPEDRGKDLEPIKRLREGQIQLYSAEKRYVTKTGKVLMANLTVSKIHSEISQSVYGLGLIEDISERKQAEDKISESNSLIRIAAEKAKLGGWNVDLKENRSYWSDVVAAIHEMPAGYNPPVEEGINFYAPEWRERIIKVFTDCALKGVTYDEEMEIITSTGKRVWVRTIGEAVRDENGRIFKVQGAFQDISEKKIAEAKIREKDLQFRKLSANVPDLIFQFTRRPDGSYCVPIASEGIKNIFGCSPEDVIDDFTPISRVLFPEDAERVIRDIEYSADHLTYFTCEFRVLIPGKPVQWIFSRSTPEKLPDGSITWYGFNANITERKLAEEELKRQLDELKRWHSVMLDREDRVLELKREINELLSRTGEPPRYPSASGRTGI